MAITRIDRDLFKDMPKNEWFSRCSTGVHYTKSRLGRMVKNGLLKKGSGKFLNMFKTNNVSDECCKCGALFNEEQYVRKEIFDYVVKAFDMTCPKCGSNEFYHLKSSM